MKRAKNINSVSEQNSQENVQSAAEVVRFDVKAVFKELIPAYIIAFSLCFMLFFYEPLMMYCVNIDDLWFDIRMMFPIVLGWFGIFFAGMCVLMTAVGFISTAASKKRRQTGLHITMIVLSGLLFLLFLEGNFFIGELPDLDGAEINWKRYHNDVPLSIAFVVVLNATVFCSWKFPVKKIAFVASYASGAVAVVMVAMLVSNLISSDAFKNKESFVATNEYYNTVSDNKNFFILMIDSVEAEAFNNIVENDPVYKETFEDFTYYIDALTCFPCTRDNIPLILTGDVNKNEKEFG